ncbi:MAG: FIST N-terminal domain-containing protein [Gammaproteobacteria bacterium]|nr:MAG: FIST N-terminal domain-containing protein [Gammaproteobacteria bacterium]
MDIEQNRWIESEGWETGGADFQGELGSSAQLVLVFGGTSALQNSAVLDAIYKTYPQAEIIGCSTAGEIFGVEVTDDTIVVTAIHFEHSSIQGTQTHIEKIDESYEAGKRLANDLTHEGLKHIFVISDGLKVNGSELVRGLNDNLPNEVSITGGLSGDGARFAETYVFLNDTPARDKIAVIGLYGDHLKVGYGSLGGWDPFGPERLITKSNANVLYELDGKSALELYKDYLGEHAADLPASALLFPLAIRASGSKKQQIVRTILAIDEDGQGMVFAGDVPEGHYAQFMKANFDRLVDGAVSAASTSQEALGSTSAELAILISCVGRKLVLKQRIEEEVEGVREVLGDKTILSGFYSYGEISPFSNNAECELHNQTMTVTTIREE